MNTARRAFTLVELMVVVTVIALLLAILLPTFGRARELARRASCSGSLSAVGRAAGQYATSHNGFYPRVPTAPGNYGLMNQTGTTVPRQVGYNRTLAPDANDKQVSYSACQWLLIKDQLATPQNFLCPSTTCTPDIVQGSEQLSALHDFTGRGNLSFSFQFNFSPAIVLSMSSRSDLAYAADMSPWAVEYTAAEIAALQFPRTHVPPSIIPVPPPPNNAGEVYADKTPEGFATNTSPNHKREGQNVLYRSGNVRWSSTFLAGVAGAGGSDSTMVDHIYTFFKTPVGSSATGWFQSYPYGGMNPYTANQNCPTSPDDAYLVSPP